jgi:hypothetical protein
MFYANTFPVGKTLSLHRWISLEFSGRYSAVSAEHSPRDNLREGL